MRRFLTTAFLTAFSLGAAAIYADSHKVPVSYRFTMKGVRGSIAGRKAGFSTASVAREYRPIYSAVPAHTRQVSHVRMKVTAYCPCSICCEKSPHDKNYGVTAKGTNAFVPNGVAADFGLLPAGTKVSIPKVGLKVVDDTGRDMRTAARQGVYHIDVRFKNHSDAQRFGSRWLNVTVIR